MKYPTIDEVAALDDEGIRELLGQQAEVEKFKEQIKELKELKGEAREEAEELWLDRIRPHIDGYSIEWIKDDAIRATQSPKELLDSESPSSIL